MVSQEQKTDYPFQDTTAAKMLKSGLSQQKQEGRSLRTIAKSLSYSQATVLSHMANGRIRVPIERATEIARAIDIDERDFLTAVVAQRTGDAHRLLEKDPTHKLSFVNDLEVIAGTSLESLSDEQKGIIREIAANSNAGRRWLSIAELPMVEMIRRAKPSFSKDGLSAPEKEFMLAALDNFD